MFAFQEFEPVECARRKSRKNINYIGFVLFCTKRDEILGIYFWCHFKAIEMGRSLETMNTFRLEMKLNFDA